VNECFVCARDAPCGFGGDLGECFTFERDDLRLLSRRSYRTASRGRDRV
jgi:hypothetical protein